MTKTEKWLLVVGNLDHWTVCEYDNEEDAKADYQGEGGKGYRIILAQITKAKGSRR